MTLRATLTVLWLFVGVAPLGAQDPPPPRAFKFTGDLSFVNTSGNRDLVTLGMGDRVEWKPGERTTLKQSLSWIYGKSEGEVNANQLTAGIRGEFQFWERLDVFVGGNYDYNLYAGVKRRFEEFAGLGVQVVETTRNALRLDAGFSYVQEWGLLEPDAVVFTAGRLVADYKLHFTEKAYLQQIAQYLPNIDNSNDYRLNSETNLVAPLNHFLAVKMSYVIRTRGRPPEGFEHTDTIFRSGIQVTF